jgi:ribose transport system permease protein
MGTETDADFQESTDIARRSIGRSGGSWNRFLQSQLLVLTAFLVVLSTAITIIAPRFLAVYNIAVITRQTSFVALVSLAQMTVMVAGLIDLSVGAVAGFTGILAAWLMVNTGFDPWLCLFLGILAGALIGLINGLLVTRLNLNAFISTLSVSFVLTGAVMVVTEGWAIHQVPDKITWIGQGTVGPVPIPTLIVVLMAVVLSFVLNRTYIGRHIYALGGNEEAAVLVGIRVQRIKLLLFGISGVLSSLSGVLMVARLASGQPTIGQTWMLPSFAAPILGGTAMSGGVGSVAGTLVGAIIMGVIQNGVVMSGMSVYWENVVIGLVLILAIFVDSLRERARQH